MKYSDKNKPLVCMQTNSTCYKGTSQGTPVGVLWHSTGSNNAWISRYVQPSANDSNYTTLINTIGKNKYNNDWNHIDVQAGLNAWIGKLADGTVATVQSMPWNYRPWGCGSGSKGSCNGKTGGPFWIQFECCEDSLTDKTYFDKVYKEACELTAYLFKKYKINPYGSVSYNGVTVPTILCHADSCALGLGSNHGDILHWFRKHGKTMDDVRKDVAALMSEQTATVTPTPTTTQQLYRVRKTWSDVASQKGAYSVLASAMACCDKVGAGYYVFDASGKVVYPKPLAIGDAVKLVEGAKYVNGHNIPTWVINSTVYVREIRTDGNVVFSTVKVGAVTGVAEPKYFKGADANITASTTTTPVAFEPYVISVDTDVLNVRKGPGTNYAVVMTINRGGVYTIIEEQNGFGRLKSNVGWICLDYTKKK